MNAFETKVANAARLFLDRKGYSVIDIAWADPGGAGGFDIVAEDEGAIVFIDVLAEEGLQPRRNHVIIMDEMHRALRASPLMVDRLDLLTRLNRQWGRAGRC